MPSGYYSLCRAAAVVLLALASPWAKADAKSTPTTPIVLEGLGQGTIALNGPWQFHPGDNPEWAKPNFDSSKWERVQADRPWGEQGHAQLTGYAWYRCTIQPAESPGQLQKLSLLIPNVRDSYELYWNGSLIGRNGKLPPHPLWYASQPMQVFSLGHIEQGVLAMRVWKAPLLSDDDGEQGGFSAAPLIGSPEAVATKNAAFEYEWLRSRQLHFAANLLSAALAFLSFLLWLRTPGRWVLFWTAGFAIAQPAVLLLLNAHMGLPYSIAMGVSEPICAMQDISLWFLLLWLLALHENRSIARITRIVACIYIVIESIDGLLVAVSWNPQWTHLAQISDAVLTIFSVLFEMLPLALIGYALRQRKQYDSARWLVAILAFVDDMSLVFSYTIKQGRQFTGWSIADKIDSPLFFVDHNGISLNTLAGSLLLVAIVYAVYNSVREDQRRQDALEREKIELLHESNRMRHHAEHDGLTGLWNHRMIVHRLGEEMLRSLRDVTPLSVILADIDHFKKVNDTFGHLAGDLVLKEIGSVLLRTLRPYDCVGRYGGEEFLLILPNCGIESALIRCEQIRSAVQSAQVRYGDSSLQVTASFGLVSVLPSHDEAEAVIRAADAALYRAKSSGRNCIIQAEVDASFCNT